MSCIQLPKTITDIVVSLRIFYSLLIFWILSFCLFKKTKGSFLNITPNWETKHKSEYLSGLEMFLQPNRCLIWIILYHLYTGVQKVSKDEFELKKCLINTSLVKIIINLSSYSHVTKRFHTDTKNICFILFTIALTRAVWPRVQHNITINLTLSLKIPVESVEDL